MTDDAKAWGDFWAQNANRPRQDGDGQQIKGGCLPQRWMAIEEAQQACWQEFGKGAKDNARVLDLATGDGRVLHWLRAGRGDLACVGIDLSPQLPPPPPGIETRSGIAMEQLPFDDDSFECVVSQFGFEYGDTQAVINEIARVLVPGGSVGLMVHRGDGPILEHNRARASEIGWVLEERGVARGAIEALGQTVPDFGAAASLAGECAAHGAKLYGQTSPAWEIAEAVRRSIAFGARSGASSVIATIGAIVAQAENELGRIASLANACARADQRDVINAGFERHGLKPLATTPVLEPSGRALADFLTFG